MTTKTTQSHEDDTIYRDETNGKCWLKCSETDEFIFLRRGNRAEAFDKAGFFERFTEVC
jgi:hypothetical protein